MTRLEEINSQELYASSVARRLKARSDREQTSMARLFRHRVRGRSAFNVPAKCTQVTPQFIHYEFLDGSTDIYPNTSGRV